MARQTADQNKLDPYKEVVILHDTKTGAINAVGSINEKTFKHSEVPPIASESKAFMEVKKTSVIKNFISNLSRSADEPYRFGFYIVPQKDMTDVVTNLQKLQESGQKDADARKALQPYRTSGKQLDKIKFDKSEMPWGEWAAMGITRDKIEPKIGPLMEGKPFPGLLPVRLQVGENTVFEGNYALRLERNENDVAISKVFAPKPVPEFEEERWKHVFSQEDKTRLLEQKPLDKLYPFHNPQTNQVEYCFAGFDPATNHLIPVNPKDIQLEEWAFRVKLDSTKMEELAMGHKVSIEKGKIGNDGVEFNGKIQYDYYQGRYVASDMVYNKPYIPLHIKEQLNPEQIGKLENYEAIDGRNIKGRSGLNYNTDIRISRQTNGLEWGNFLRQAQNQTQAQAQAPAQQQTPQWPDNDTHQAQGQSQGPRM